MDDHGASSRYPTIKYLVLQGVWLDEPANVGKAPHSDGGDLATKVETRAVAAKRPETRSGK